MTARDFQAAGLYDPRAANAAERLELLDWLAGRGISIDQMRTAERAGRLVSLAGDLALRPGPRLTPRELATRYGLGVDYLTRLSLAVGLPPRSPDDPIYTEDDARMLAGSVGGAQLFGEQAALRFVRVVGSALARVAEAALSLFQVNVEAPLKDAGTRELTLAQRGLGGIESLEMVRTMLHDLFPAHIETAIRRFREARPRRSPDTATMAVGFVDLVGFTPLAHRLTTSQLAPIVDRFEDAAYDIAAARDGRVVKLVGDEVMFVTRDPAAACDIALTLVERFAGDPAVTPRGGVAFGEVLVRGGDYYGPIVNLAARLAQIAVPNEVLVTIEVVVAAHSLRFEPAGKRMLKGFDEPIALSTVARG